MGGTLLVPYGAVEGVPEQLSTGDAVTPPTAAAVEAMDAKLPPPFACVLLLSLSLSPSVLTLTHTPRMHTVVCTQGHTGVRVGGMRTGPSYFFRCLWARPFEQDGRASRRMLDPCLLRPHTPLTPTQTGSLMRQVL